MPLLNFMKFIIPAVLALGLFYSCNNASENDPSPNDSIDESVIFGKKDFQYPQLSAPAMEEAVHWGILEDFLSEAKNLNGSNYQQVRNSSELLRQYSDSLFKKIPDTLNTRPINSRLIVLKTRSTMLYQAAHLPSMDSAKVQNSLNELNQAIVNFIVQLNEKFQKDNIDFQRKEDEQTELKKQQRYKDSILNLELQDKKNKKV